MPDNNQSQKKTNYRFTIHYRSSFYGWYNAYFEVQLLLQKLADGAGYPAADRITVINGLHSLIRHMTIKSAGKIVYDTIIATLLRIPRTCLSILITFQEVWQKIVFGI